jgi:DNA polymerase-3 subunit chi
MTQVDFYIPAAISAGDTVHRACLLADGAFQEGRRVYIHTQDAETARHLDRLLWTYSAGCFVPHTLDAASCDLLTPVCIGNGPPPEGCEEVLISLAGEVPAYFGRFERVVDIVGPTDEEKQLARERYRFYRDRGYDLQTHDL